MIDRQVQLTITSPQNLTVIKIKVAYIIENVSTKLIYYFWDLVIMITIPYWCFTVQCPIATQRADFSQEPVLASSTERKYKCLNIKKRVNTEIVIFLYRLRWWLKTAFCQGQA